MNASLRIVLPFLFLFCLAAARAQEAPSFVRDSLDTYVIRALKEWKIPGVAVCVVKDGKVVVMKGYGLRETGKEDKVDEHTLFGIGSNTKAFTATALAMLESDKKLSLDDKVQKWLPDFTLFDPWVAKEANIRDLLSHRLGFETFQGDFMFFDSDLSIAQVRQKFGQIKPLHSFRSKWGYANAAFLTAGEIIPKASGKSWEQFLRERLFAPLGMTRTLATSGEYAGATNLSAAHTVVKGEIRKIPYGRLDNIAPAGSIASSAADMSKWVLALLNNGKVGDNTVIPPAALSQTRLPHSIMGNGGHMFNKAHFALYGLGWFLESYSGRRIVSHTGGVNGFVTSVALVPEEKLGIIVLTNTDANNFYEALRYELMDAYLGLPYRNYSQVYLDFTTRQDKATEASLQKKQDTIAMKPATALPLAAFAGTYRHPIYGTMVLKQSGNKLTATLQHHKGLEVALEPLGGTRFLATFSNPMFGVRVWPFTLGNGKVKSLTLTVSDFIENLPYEFVKQN
jgi:CubicO group peptidase (beta-lactamase class C family)